MSLLQQLTCLFRGHSLGTIEPDMFWFSATCSCCGKTMTADSALELLMMAPQAVQVVQGRDDQTRESNAQSRPIQQVVSVA